MEHVQGLLFEEDYLVRSLGALAYNPYIALTELVANAWDAGAASVSLTVPEDREKPVDLIVQDDGTGMTLQQFEVRWMTLGYNRVKNQGEMAEFPPERGDCRRRAYGRNGVGRHGMLCFSDDYVVETCRDGIGSRVTVSAKTKSEPFAVTSTETFSASWHGTKLIAKALRNVPDVKKVRDVLSARFLSDPQFLIAVNGSHVPLSEHKGLVDRKTLKVNDKVTLEAYCIDSSKSARTVQPHGVAFWVGGRLVGDPSWALGDRVLVDGRTWVARRHTVVIKTDDLFDEVHPDWSAFKRTTLIDRVYDVVVGYVESLFQRLFTEKIEETKVQVVRQHREGLAELHAYGRHQVAEFVNALTRIQPSISTDTLSTALDVVIGLERSRSGVALLQKLSTLSEEDIEGLNRLLEDWTVRDALAVLDVIDRRLVIVEALEKLSADDHVDELSTLHPLVAQARWLFGPEFDSPHYSSNLTLRSAVEKVFGKRLDRAAFQNYRSRPDIVVLRDATTISTVGTEEIDPSSNISMLRRVLIVELKRGGFRIGRDEVNQANAYVEEFLSCGVIDGSPYVQAFVVGHEVDSRVQSPRRIGEQPEVGRIDVCTYSQLVRTASARLFRLRDELNSRYQDTSGIELVQKVLSEPVQPKLLEEQASVS